jgi:hypothetical protein
MHRRTFLALAGIGAVAGCLGGDGDPAAANATARTTAERGDRDDSGDRRRDRDRVRRRLRAGGDRDGGVHTAADADPAPVGASSRTEEKTPSRATNSSAA